MRRPLPRWSAALVVGLLPLLAGCASDDRVEFTVNCDPQSARVDYKGRMAIGSTKLTASSSHGPETVTVSADGYRARRVSLGSQVGSEWVYSDVKVVLELDPEGNQARKDSRAKERADEAVQAEARRAEAVRQADAAETTMEKKFTEQATALQLADGGLYRPGGSTPLKVTAIMSDGTAWTDSAIWKFLEAKASHGSVREGSFVDPDMRASLGKSVTIELTSAVRPGLGATFTLAPDYDSLPTSFSFEGLPGDGGRVEGPSGSPGGAGGRGQDGPEVRVFLERVRGHGRADSRSFVFARVASGNQEVTTIFDPTQKKLTVASRGGPGGPGGAGQSGETAGTAGKGGPGGNGGRGGRGGNGGRVTVVYEAGHPELADFVSVDAPGGSGGPGGVGGPGGGGFAAGSERPSDVPGDKGADGEPGEPGEASTPVIKPSS
jgi:hypothetical protein